MSTSTADAEVAQLAYSLWQQRGCPYGSPEVDWFKAEDQLRQRASERVCEQTTSFSSGWKIIQDQRRLEGMRKGAVDV
jgi:hypothetical protein